jgi:hypothetical protein
MWKTMFFGGHLGFLASIWAIKKNIPQGDNQDQLVIPNQQ